MSRPDIRSAVWKSAIGILVALPVATQLIDTVVKNREVRARNSSYTLLNNPLKHNSRAFSNESQRFSSNNLVSHFSSAWSYALRSPCLIAAINGENMSLSNGKRFNSSGDGR